MFTKKGERKKYGLGHNKTLFSFEVSCIIIAILVFFIAESIAEIVPKISISLSE